jgi:hypothetical protein
MSKIAAATNLQFLRILAMKGNDSKKLLSAKAVDQLKKEEELRVPS